jgi:hypothetical protein
MCFGSIRSPTRCATTIRANCAAAFSPMMYGFLSFSISPPLVLFLSLPSLFCALARYFAHFLLPFECLVRMLPMPTIFSFVFHVSTTRWDSARLFKSYP